MQFHEEKKLWIYLISRVFLPALFLNFLAPAVVPNKPNFLNFFPLLTGPPVKYSRAISYNRSSSNVYYTMNYSQEDDLDEQGLLSPNRNQYSCNNQNILSAICLHPCEYRRREFKKDSI